jgi:hypothetical protein
MSRSLPTRRMLIGAACVVIATTAFGCTESSAAPMPLPTLVAAAGDSTNTGSDVLLGSGSAFIWVLVLAQSGACIPGGTVYVLSGPAAGRTFVQDSDCTAWAYSGGVLFRGLAVGATMTLRASAPGYSSRTKTAVAVSSGQAVEFVLDPIPASPSR